MLSALLGCAAPADGGEEVATSDEGGASEGESGSCDGVVGCAAGCPRNAPSVIATLQQNAWTATFDGDGSLLVVSSGSPYSLARFAADGTELWRTPIDGGGSGVAVERIRGGAQIVLVGARLGGDPRVGALWRFAADGTPLGRVDDEVGRDFLDGDVAGDGEAEVLVGSLEAFGTTVERRSVDGTVVSSHAIDPDGKIAALRVALVDDDVVVGVGFDVDTAAAAIVRIAGDDVAHARLSTSDYPDATLYAVAADGQGGAVAVGDSAGASIVARIAGDGEIAWISACSSSRVAANDILVANDRVVVHGRRFLPEDGCVDACSGAYAPWVQHLALDGAAIAWDTPAALRTPAEDSPYESVVALTPDGNGDAIVLGSAIDSSYLARFPW